MSQVSDGFHTFAELYRYRAAYNAAAFNAWHRLGLFDVHKSMYHHDGTRCFDGDWFIVVAQLPTGQISNHYRADQWGLFQIPARLLAAKWDGHTPEQAVERLEMWLTTDLLNVPMDRAAMQITAISAWIDYSPGYVGLDPEAHNWRRIQKCAQEVGEAFEAYCGTLGENPRKGVTHTTADVEAELFDVALSALGAVEHLNRNDGETMRKFIEHIRSVCDRALGSMEGK
jgi:hypothetical protein